MFAFFSFYFVAWVCVCSADDAVVQVFSKNPVNYISEKFISYSIDPTELLEMSKENQDSFVYRVMESGPCFLKIYGNNTNNMRLNGDSIDLNTSKLSLDQLKSVYDVLRTADIKPVIALPYDPKQWNTRNVMRILGKVNMLGMNDIVWQLGADFHAKDAISYIDDLNTLKLIVGAFATKESKKNWSVVGSDITIGSSEEEARIFSEFSKHIVDAIGWTQSIELNYSDENIDDFFSSFNIDPALRTTMNGESPVWLSLVRKDVEAKTPLAQMKQGLTWAQVLGDAAKSGFKVIYSPIKKQTWYESTLTYYTTLLHKRIIGQTVFDTKMFNGNRFDSHFYAHCTKNISGSFTVFGVNSADSRLDITAKLPFRSGREYSEFILTVGVNGKVSLNGVEIIEPSVLSPIAKFKLPGKSALMSMPAHSVAFWVFVDASIPECESVEPISFEMYQQPDRTSSDQLLQQLIVETVARDEMNDEDNSIKRSKREAEMPGMIDRVRRNTENTIDKQSEYNAIEMNEQENTAQPRDKRFIGNAMLASRIYNDLDDMKRRHLVAPYKSKLPGKRMKRDINMLKNLFDKFDLKNSPFNFKAPPFKFGAMNMIPTISTVHDVMNPEPMEKKLFDAVENPDLPTGDIHFEIEAAVTEPNEYAAALNAANKMVEQQPFYPMTPSVDVYSSVGLASPVILESSNAVNSAMLPGELTEFDVKAEVIPMAPAPPPPQPVAKLQTVNAAQTLPPAQHAIEFVVKDLPPTWNVNRENLEKTKNNLRHNLWPMNAQTIIQPAVQQPIAINALLPNVAQIHTLQPDEHVLFESKRRRRRRAIDNKMNEEIEKRVQRFQRGAPASEIQRLDDGVDVDLLDKMLRLFDDMERKQNIVKKSHGLGIGKLLANRQSEARDVDATKKCKVLSMAMEQQCLDVENRQTTLFKRAIEPKKRSTGPLKKFIAKIKDNKSMKYRNKRSASEPINSEENELNSILKDIDGEGYGMSHRIVYDRRRYESKLTTSTTPKATTEIIKETPSTKRPVPRFLHQMKAAVNGITNVVAHQIGRIWYNLSA